VTLFADAGSIGAHAITAVYEGASGYQGSVSNSVTLTVLPPQIVFHPPWFIYFDRGRAY
jgi:hypothetical protein